MDKKPSYGNHVCLSEKCYCKELTEPVDLPPTTQPGKLTYTLNPTLTFQEGQVFVIPVPSKDVTNPINRKGQVALIAAGSTGLGKWAAKALAASGMKVIVTSRFPKRHPKPKGYMLSSVSLDMTSEESVRHFFNKVIKPIGKIDVLVTTGNFEWWGLAKDATGEDLTKQFNLTVSGQQRVIQNALPYMRHSNSTRVVVLGSASGEFPVVAGNVGYAMSKRALQVLTQTLNVEEAILKARGVVKGGPFFSLVEPYFVTTKIGSYEYNIPHDTTSHNKFVRASKYFQEFQILGLSEVTTPTQVADAILSIALSQQPSTRYLVVNPNATIEVAGTPVSVTDVIIDFNSLPADEINNILAPGFNADFEAADELREIIFQEICPGQLPNDSKCGNSNKKLCCKNNKCVKKK